jgi:RNA-binding protein NOB1
MKYLVVDSGPLIKGARLDSIQADAYITVPEVIHEIRDPTARARLERLPFEIVIKEPSDEAVARVSAFARKTGDYAALSAPDIKVLALTWMLEKECNGAIHLKTEPAPIVRGPPRRAQAPPPAAAAAPAAEPAAAPALPSRAPLGSEDAPLSATDAEAAVLAALAQVHLDDDNDNESGSADAEADDDDDDDERAAEGVASTHTSAWRRLPGWATAMPTDSSLGARPAHADAGSAAAGADADDEDADIPWITPANVQHAQRKDSRFCYAPDASTDVCCMTTDFAMQNVLLRMGMRLLSAEGMVMKSVKQWGLQCSGCFRTSHDMARVFCDHCGNQTLVRVALVVDRDGRERVLPIPQTVKERLLSTRGTVYALAAPKAGRNAGNAITSEDALVEVRLPARARTHARTLLVRLPLSAPASRAPRARPMMISLVYLSIH